MESVCRLWHPPSTPAIAWYATRTMLLSGCCSVREHPAVCTCVFMNHERSFFAP
jgi:hypothetical protein